MIFLLVVSILIIVTAIKGNQADVVATLKGDLTEGGNFMLWIMAIVLIGAIGFIKPLRKVSRITMVLVALVFLLANKGAVSKILPAIKALKWPSPSTLEGEANVVGSTSGEIGTPEQQQASQQGLPMFAQGQLPGQSQDSIGSPQAQGLSLGGIPLFSQLGLK